MEARRVITLTKDSVIIQLKASAGDWINRSKPLFIYEPRVASKSSESKKEKVAIDEDPKRLIYESPFEGTFEKWLSRSGDLVSAGQFFEDTIWLIAIRKPIAFIKEACSHPVNFGGLCGVCGKDLTISEGGKTREDARVSIIMTHENNRVFVSQEVKPSMKSNPECLICQEAHRIEHETAKRLRDEKKLSLILDLDQTVIHATVDQNIGTFLSTSKGELAAATLKVSQFHYP